MQRADLESTQYHSITAHSSQTATFLLLRQYPNPRVPSWRFLEGHGLALWEDSKDRYEIKPITIVHDEEELHLTSSTTPKPFLIHQSSASLQVRNQR